MATNTVPVMDRKLSKTDRLAADSLYEVKDAADQVAKELGRTIKFNGQRLSVQGLLNALVLDFLNKPRVEQEKIVDYGITRLNQLLASEKEIELPTSIEAGGFTLSEIPSDSDLPPAAPPKKSTRKTG